MTDLRVCVRFECCQASYYALAMAARPHSELLQRVRFMPPDYWLAWDTLVASMNVLVPPDMFGRWASIDDTIAPEHMGEQILYMEIMRVCKRERLMTEEELYG